MRVGLVILGLVLLAPGACSLVFMAGMIVDLIRYRNTDGGLIGLFVTVWAVGFAISAVGVMVLRRARKPAEGA